MDMTHNRKTRYTHLPLLGPALGRDDLLDLFFLLATVLLVVVLDGFVFTFVSHG